jgi:hypothetical protein
MLGHGRDGVDRERLVAEIYKAVLGGGSLSNLLGQLAHLTNSDKAFWGFFDLQRRTGRFLDSYNADPRMVERYNAGGAAANPWLAKAQYFQAPDLIWHGSKIILTSDLARTSFFKDFLEPQQIFHTLHIVISVEGAQVTHVMLTRPLHDGEYRAADIELAHCFAFHARKAGESAGWMSGVRMIQMSLSDIVDDAGLGVAVFEPPALVYASKSFERCLQSVGATAVPHGMQPGAGKPILFPKPLADAIYKHDYATATPLVMERRDGEGRLLIVVKPSLLENGRYPARKALIVTVFALDQPVIVNEDLLRRAYGLTVSEAHICSPLAQGARVEPRAGAEY